MTALRFAKMHALGNDFMVVDSLSQPFDPRPSSVRALANRNTGVGFDQLLVLGRAQSKDADLRLRIFNADGGEVFQCGNGLRCTGRYIRDRNLLPGSSSWRLETGPMRFEVREADQPPETARGAAPWFQVDMGAPALAPGDIPFSAAAQQRSVYALPIAGQTVEISALSLGNPHAVVIVDQLDDELPAKLAPPIASREFFPDGVNVGFAQVLSPSAIALRVVERGAGETQACASGACAATVAAKLRGFAQSEWVRVQMPGGEIEVSWADDEGTVRQRGPACEVYAGEIEPHSSLYPIMSN